MGNVCSAPTVDDPQSEESAGNVPTADVPEHRDGNEHALGDREALKTLAPVENDVRAVEVDAEATQPGKPETFATKVAVFLSEQKGALDDALATVNELELPSRLEGLKDDVSNEIGRCAADAVLAAVGASVVDTVGRYVPLAATAISLGGFALEHLRAMRENRELAKELVELVNELVDLLPKYMGHFASTGQDVAMRYAHKLMEVMVVTARLADGLRTGSSWARRCVAFLAASSDAAALEENRKLLMEGMGAVGFHFGKSVIDQEERLQTLERALSAREAVGGDEDYLKPLRTLKASEDAVQFWQSRAFGANVAVQYMTREMIRLAVDAGLADRKYARLPKKHPFYDEFFASLDLNGDEMTEPQELAGFIGPDATTVAEAVEEFFEDMNGGSGNGSVDIDRLRVRLDSLLQPVDMGPDIDKHLRQYEPGTREYVFRDVREWAANRKRAATSDARERAFWIQGTGGLGKSIIAAQLVRRGNRAASGEPEGENDTGMPRIIGRFFCKHDDANRNDPRRALGTLAAQVAREIPEFAEVLDKASPGRVKDLLSGADGSVDDCFEELLATPLRAALEGKPADEHVYLLLDALDELRPGAGRAQFLRIVAAGLLRLPPQVHLIATSRPEEDIKAHLKALSPFVVDKYEDLQLDDLRVFARRRIVDETSLRHLGPEEKGKAIEALVLRAEGVFLALRLCHKHLRSLDETVARDLQLDDVEGMPSEMIDGTYSETLERVWARVDGLDVGPIRDSMRSALRRTLAVLVASARPLTLLELTRVCGAVDSTRGQDDLLTETILGALSLLFAPQSGAVGGDAAPIEPLHKTVFDFLLDPTRSGVRAVDLTEGHAVLAVSCARVLRRSLDGGHDAVQEAFDSVREYALEYGVYHMTLALRALSEGLGVSCEDGANGKTASDAQGRPAEGTSHQVSVAVRSWRELFLTPRRRRLGNGADTAKWRRCGMANDLPAGVKPHAFEATAAAARWLVARARMGGAKILASRLRALRDVLEPFEGAKTLDAEEDVSALRAHAQVTAWLAGLSWAPYASSSATDDGGLLRASAAHLYATPMTSTWWASDGAVVLGGDEFATEDGHGQVEWSSRACEAMARNTDKDPLEVVIHTGQKRLHLAFSPDGSRIASAGDGDGGKGTMTVWDAATGERVATLEGHSQWVMSLAFSPDGRRLASGSGDDTVRVWDAATGECVATLEGHHTSGVYSVAFSPDGSRILSSGSYEKTAQLWDAANGESVATLEMPYVVKWVAFSPDGSRIMFFFSRDMTVRVSDAATGESITVVTLEGHSLRDSLAMFSPDKSRIASESNDDTVRVWDTATGECVVILEGHSGKVTSLAFSPDGRRLASGSMDETVRVWDVATGECVATLEGHTNGVGVASVAFSLGGYRIASTCYLGKTLLLWDVATGERMATLEGHLDRLIRIAFSPDGSRIASGSDDGELRVWDAATGECAATPEGHSHRVVLVAFSPDGSRIASSGGWDKMTASADTKLRVWDAATGECVATLECHSESVSSLVAFSPDGSRIVSGGVFDMCYGANCMDTTLRIWDASTGECLATLEGHSDAVLSTECSQDWSRIASGSQDKTVRVWDAATGECVATLEGHSSGVYSVAFSPDGSRIASGSDDETVRVWDAATGECVVTLKKSEWEWVVSVAFSPDGSRIASGAFGSADNLVRLWDAATGECVATVQGSYLFAFSPDGSCIASIDHNDQTFRLLDAATGECVTTLEGHIADVEIGSVAFSPDGSRIAFGSDDKRVRVWDAATGECVATLEGHSGAVNSVAFSPDGSRIASGSDDRTVRVWNRLTLEDRDDSDVAS